MILRDALKQIRLLSLGLPVLPVERTVAVSLAGSFACDAKVEPAPAAGKGATQFLIAVANDEQRRARPGAWMSFQIEPDGSGQLVASHEHWLYALYALVTEEWINHDAVEFAKGRTIRPTFPWFRNLNDFFVGSLRTARHFDPNAYMQRIARLGFSHVTINGLGVPRPFESGPPGDVYSWFYDYSPDLDQFVDSTLIKGYYPFGYLQANLRALKQNAALAAAYGLTPGLHINSPRSMPEDFWDRYGFLRGARVDHPRETLRPRYALAMAHPAVQDHYRQLVRRIMQEVPQLGFIHMWSNDSGSGFEFVTALYAGRNGGPYLIREWKNDDEIARAASRNVLTYYRLLRDEARKSNPEFRLICDLGSFTSERKYIIPELGDGIDAGDFGSFQGFQSDLEQAQLLEAGSLTHFKVDTGDTNVIGIPFPYLVHERLMSALARGTRALLLGSIPGSLAPYDINGEVVRAVQLIPATPLDEFLEMYAVRWAGNDHAPSLIEIWRLVDDAVRAFPQGVPLSTFAFPWFRLWGRPFAPDIDTIPESERSYYEAFLLATFNNPARIDLNNDMMWNFLTVQLARQKKMAFDSSVLPPLGKAIGICASVLHAAKPAEAGHDVFRDIHDRLVGFRCYCVTMRNMCAWTESVHGYLEAETDREKNEYRALCRDMVQNETENARALLGLWKRSTVDFMPVSTGGETIHVYGQNFGELLEKKIALMEQHKDDEPRIDPDYMWRMPTQPH